MKRPPLILSGGAKYGITRNYHLIIQSAVLIPMAPYLEQLIVVNIRVLFLSGV
jgi:hypothetical protein